MDNPEQTQPLLKTPLGYNLAGCEKAFEKHLSEALARTGAFTYLEIGIAEGVTLLAVSEYLNRVRAGTSEEDFLDWQAIGLDLTCGPFFHAGNYCIMAHMCGLPLSIHSVPQGGLLHAQIQSNTVSVILSYNPREVLKATKEILDFVLIDGCHGAPCVKADFLAIEDKVYSGGIVAFHDACIEDQGVGMQHHCGEPINVRKALEELDLITPIIDGVMLDHRTRPGWTLLEEVHGDKSANPPGNGMIFFRKE